MKIERKDKKYKSKDLGMIVDMNIDECFYYQSSVGKLDIPTYFNFIIKGCYMCDGQNRECPGYMSRKAMYELALNGIKGEYN
jgi:hypothetical protein